MNTFGTKFRLTSFGESHGAAIGGVIDGMPAGVEIDMEFIQNELDKRRPGRNKFATARSEADKIEIFSGIFEGFSTGAPIGFAIFNSNQKSNDYDDLRELFRPGHADFAYYAKYGIRDHRGGGRASARETAVRVAGGAFAQLVLKEFGIEAQSGVLSVGDIVADALDWELAARSEIFSLGREDEMKAKILEIKNAHDSIGASVLTQINGVPAGLGEGLYDRLDARLAAAFMGINGVKAVEIGEGVRASLMTGSQNNDEMSFEGGQNFSLNGEAEREILVKNAKFSTNCAGGILGGISSGETIVVKAHFKPTPSIFKAQKTLTKSGEPIRFELRGRHDPCIGVRGSVVATAMARLVVADMLLLNVGATLENLKKIYR